jgi:hypothetical protein
VLELVELVLELLLEPVLELVELVLELLPEPVLELVHGPKPLGLYQRPERQELAPY